MKVGLEKLESHEGVVIKALLDSGAIGLFMDTTFTKEKGFKMEKLKKPLLVRNVDGTTNAEGAIMHQVECNMFFKGHMEKDKNKETLRRLVPRKFWKWRKVFGKKESERMPVWKTGTTP